MKKLFLIIVALSITLLSIAQSRQLSGKVIDDEDVPIPGAVVQNNTTKAGAVTDNEGRFSIEVEVGQTLAVSMLGYEPQTITVTAQDNITIKLIEDSQLLDDLVVVGYAVQKKINLTGAVSSIDGDQLTRRPVTSATLALQGADPSMNIQASSGNPAGGNSIDIRGVPSINGGSPLILVDGVPGISLDRINASDIESVSILKDASASAIYGAKASAGVILITTKSGRPGTTKVSYSNMFGWIQPTTSTDFISTGYDWATAVDEVYYGRYGYSAFRYTEADWAELEARRYDTVENPDRPWVTVDDTGQYHYYGNFDWYHEMFNNNRFQQQHDLSISGGDNAVTYYLSAKYYDQDGLLSGSAISVKEKFQTYAFRAKIDAQLYKWAKWSTNVSVNAQHQVYPGTLNESLTISALDQALGPMFVPQNPDGSNVIYPYDIRGVGIGKGRGAITTAEGWRHDIDNRNLVLANTLELTPFEGFRLAATYNISNYHRMYKDRDHDATYSDKIGTVITNTSYSRDQYRERPYEYTMHSIDLVTSYNKIFNDAHNFNGLAGMNYEYQRATDLTVLQYGVGSPYLNTFNSVTDDTNYIISQSIGAYKTLGFFGRLNYNYKEKYLAEISMRTDGTSRFEEQSRWGVFPSASVGWRFSQENFMDEVNNWLNDGKIRFSYGSLGNQQVSNYQYIQTITSGRRNYLFDEQSGPSNYANVTAPNSSGLTWETVKTYNAGLDFSFFNSRLNFTGDYFVRLTEDMLATALTLPSVYGASTPRENNADLMTNGWEIKLSWKDQFHLGSKPFHYGVTATLGDYVTEITKFNNPDKIFNSFYEGKRLGEIWGYHVPRLFNSDEEAAAYQMGVHNSSNVYQRVYNEAGGGRGYLMAGDIMFEDRNGDGYINRGSGTVDDPGDMMIIGNSLPRYNYSLRNDFDWNNFDLSLLFQGVGKRDWYPTANPEDVYGSTRFWNLYSYPLMSFVAKDYKDNIWTEDNPDGYFPRLRTIQTYGGGPLAQNNDRYLQKVNYLRVKNITFGYTAPLKNTFINSCRLYFSGENLFYWSPMKNNSKYVDPELAVGSGTYRASTGTGYTMPRTITFGVNLNF